MYKVSTKSVQLCVEFYYLWKAMHPESFRARTRMVEVESEQVNSMTFMEFSLNRIAIII